CASTGVSAAYEGGEVAGSYEGSFVVDDCLHLPANVLGDVCPRAGCLVLVVSGEAGDVADGYCCIADDHGGGAGGPDAGHGLEGGAELGCRVLGGERVGGR